MKDFTFSASGKTRKIFTDNIQNGLFRRIIIKEVEKNIAELF